MAQLDISNLASADYEICSSTSANNKGLYVKLDELAAKQAIGQSLAKATITATMQ